MLSQLLANGIVHGSILALLAAGFAVAHLAGRFFVFTYGASVAIGGYALVLVSPRAGIGTGAAIAVAVAAISGFGFELAIYRPIRNAGGGALVQMLASIGAYVVVQNLISITFSDATRSPRTWLTTPGIIFFPGMRLTSLQIISFACAAGALALTLFTLRYTQLGRDLRAVANDRELASAVGIPVPSVMALASLLSAALAGLAGVLLACDTDVIPTMGFSALLFAIIGCIAGGLSNVGGAAVGGLLLGIFRQLTIWRLPAHWAETLLFFLLVVFLIVRPQGLVGKPLRIGHL